MILFNHLEFEAPSVAFLRGQQLAFSGVHFDGYGLYSYPSWLSFFLSALHLHTYYAHLLWQGSESARTGLTETHPDNVDHTICISFSWIIRRRDVISAGAKSAGQPATGLSGIIVVAFRRRSCITTTLAFCLITFF